jgi:predicted short-subunit dehydrogenase-like oxidoreductase (DUF2520 family)
LILQGSSIRWLASPGCRAAGSPQTKKITIPLPIVNETLAQSALKFDKKLAFASSPAYLLNMPARPRKSPLPPVTLVGLGGVGRALAHAIREAGCRELVLIGRGRRGERSLAHALKARHLSNLRQLTQDHGLIVICARDNQIASVAQELTRLKLNWSRLTVLHTSGVLGSAVLKPLASKSAAVAAWHPYMTFPKGGQPVSFAGVTFGTSGDVQAMRAAGRLARMLGGRPLRLREQDRALYHLSAVLACGFVAANLDLAVSVLKKIGLSEKRALETVLPIASQTLENVAELGPKRALTGPAVRGDTATIRKHLRELRKLDPELARYYVTVSRYLLRKS